LSYTQSPPLTGDEIESFLREAKTARFCSHNGDGTIHAAPVWYSYEGGKLIIGTPLRSRKARNVRRDGRVTVLVDVDGPPAMGVIIYGRAKLEEFSVDDVSGDGPSIFRRYMPEEAARAYAEGLSRITRWARITVTPLRVASFDYGKDEVYREAVRGL
jgi:hypothetical protein